MEPSRLQLLQVSKRLGDNRSRKRDAIPDSLLFENLASTQLHTYR